MTRIWALDGVTVYSAGLATNGTSIQGIGFTPKGRYLWWADVNSEGWCVHTKQEVNYREEMFQGSTFNLALEVASAMRRAL